MARVPKCKPTHHRDRVRRSGRVKCEVCNDVYPCKKVCIHIDCAEAKDDFSGLPSWIAVRSN